MRATLTISVFLLLIIICPTHFFRRPIAAQDPLAQPAEGVDDSSATSAAPPPATVQEALERRSAVHTEAAANLAAAQASFNEAIMACDAELIASLKMLAKSSIAAGDLSQAATRWEEVLKFDAADVDAKAFFETIKRGDVVKKYWDKREKQWQALRRIEFHTVSGRVFSKLPNGVWLENTNKIKRIHREIERNDYFVLIELEDGNERHLLLPDRFFWNNTNDRGIWRIDEPGQWIK
jgi:hypothetical protein